MVIGNRWFQFRQHRCHVLRFDCKKDKGTFRRDRRDGWQDRAVRFGGKSCRRFRVHIARSNLFGGHDVGSNKSTRQRGSHLAGTDETDS
jgi:hypothetical protein